MVAIVLVDLGAVTVGIFHAGQAADGADVLENRVELHLRGVGGGLGGGVGFGAEAVFCGLIAEGGVDVDGDARADAEQGDEGVGDGMPAKREIHGACFILRWMARPAFCG